MAVEQGDVMGLLRTSFWRSWLGRTWKITLAFTNAWPRLTPFYQVGQAQPCCFGQGKLYHLRQGLTEEFKQGILGSILAYESPHTGAPADYAKAVQLLQVEGTNVTLRQPVRVTATIVRVKGEQLARSGRVQGDPKSMRAHSPGRSFAKPGRCERGEKCRWQHVQALGGRQTVAEGQEGRVSSSRKWRRPP